MFIIFQQMFSAVTSVLTTRCLTSILPKDGQQQGRRGAGPATTWARPSQLKDPPKGALAVLLRLTWGLNSQKLSMKPKGHHNEDVIFKFS